MKPAEEPLHCFEISAPLETEEALVELLTEIFGTPPVATRRFPAHQTVVSAYLTAKNSWSEERGRRLAHGLVQIIRSGLSLKGVTFEWKPVRRMDWAESWKEHFRPLTIGKVLRIRPSWSPAGSGFKGTEIVIDPGLSFGTGQHPTTEYCLHELVRLKPKDGFVSFLDVGTGSGILAIAAARLGYTPVAAFDYDPDSVRIARENARINGVEKQVRVTRADLRKPGTPISRRYEVICANLTADLLEECASKITDHLTRDGSLVLAGILETQFEDVQRKMKSLGFRLVQSETQGEWRSGTFARRGPKRRSGSRRERRG